jgi:hypothetical protein
MQEKPRVSVHSKSSSSDDDGDDEEDDVIIQLVVPHNMTDVETQPVPVSLASSVESDSTDSDSIPSSDHIDSDVDNTIAQIPIPAPRHSLRNRTRPAWMDSGQWVQSQVSTIDPDRGKQFEMANFLSEIASKYSYLPESVLLKIISTVEKS